MGWEESHTQRHQSLSDEQQTCCSCGSMYRQSSSMDPPWSRKDHLHPSLPFTLHSQEVINSICLLPSFNEICGHLIHFRFCFPPLIQLTVIGLGEEGCGWQCCCIRLVPNGNVAKNWAVCCFVLLVIKRHHQIFANKEHYKMLKLTVILSSQISV